jgi:hypothetical protein
VGASAFTLGTSKNRIIALVADAMSASGSWLRSSGHSMFDCPLQTHTSPTNTFVNVTPRVADRTSIVHGPPAFIGRNRTSHRPLCTSVVARREPT